MCSQSVRFLFEWLHQDQVSQESTHASHDRAMSCEHEIGDTIYYPLNLLIKDCQTVEFSNSWVVKMLKQRSTSFDALSFDALSTIANHTKAKLDAIYQDAMTNTNAIIIEELLTAIIQNRWTRQIRITCRIGCKKWVKRALHTHTHPVLVKHKGRIIRFGHILSWLEKRFPKKPLNDSNAQLHGCGKFIWKTDKFFNDGSLYWSP
jgi:hypothetical protein